jgi:hypothetical protein
MNNDLIWQPNSSQPDNGENLKAIAKWWSSLAGKEILWQQRLIAATGNLQDIDWQSQKFDEKFVLLTPQLKGITIFWRNSKAADERNITPSKLQFNLSRQLLYVFPQSQSQVVIRIKLPETLYQKLDLKNPQIAAAIKDGSGIILLRDETQQLEIKVTLDQERLKQLLDRLNNNDN